MARGGFSEGVISYIIAPRTCFGISPESSAAICLRNMEISAQIRSQQKASAVESPHSRKTGVMVTASHQVNRRVVCPWHQLNTLHCRRKRAGNCCNDEQQQSS